MNKSFMELPEQNRTGTLYTFALDWGDGRYARYEVTGCTHIKLWDSKKKTAIVLKDGAEITLTPIVEFALRYE